MGPRIPTFFFAAIIVFLTCTFAHARRLFKEGSNGNVYSFDLKTSAKLVGLVSLPSRDETVDERELRFASLLRARIEPILRLCDFSIATAYDNQLFFVSNQSLTAGFVLPVENDVPFRFWQLVHSTQFGNFVDVGQLDRATLTGKFGPLSISIGRQAIGMGRSLMFSAVDIFAPFTPLQLDQEWRMGIDAINVDLRIGGQFSLQAIVTGAKIADEIAAIGRARGYIGDVDLDVVLGKRARDFVIGAASSMALGDLALQGEVAVFRVPDSSWISKVVFGFSNNFLIGDGLFATLEYHYSGFGAGSADGLAGKFVDDDFLARLARGDTQIIGAHALGLSANYSVGIDIVLSLGVVQSLIDASGTISPSVVWDFSDFASLLGSVYLGYGAGPLAGIPQSQFGATPISGVIQLRVYD